MIKKVISVLAFALVTSTVKSQVVTCGSPLVNLGLPITYCAQVKGSSYDSLGNRGGTILFLCLDFPYQTMTIVIKDKDEPMFPYTTAQWIGFNICVTGTVNTFKGKPYIEVKKRTMLHVN